MNEEEIPLEENIDPQQEDVTADESVDEPVVSEDVDEPVVSEDDNWEPEVRSKEEEEEQLATLDDSIDPEEAQIIQKVVQGQLAPVAKLQKRVSQIDTKADVLDFVTSNPEFSKYRNLITTYATHEAYAKIPIKNIAAMVAAKDLQKMGAKKEREASKLAQETQGSAQPAARKSSSTETDWLNVSDDEFYAKRNEVMRYNG